MNMLNIFNAEGKQLAVRLWRTKREEHAISATVKALTRHFERVHLTFKEDVFKPELKSITVYLHGDHNFETDKMLMHSVLRNIEERLKADSRQNQCNAFVRFCVPYHALTGSVETIKKEIQTDSIINLLYETFSKDHSIFKLIGSGVSGFDFVVFIDPEDITRYKIELLTKLKEFLDVKREPTLNDLKLLTTHIGR